MIVDMLFNRISKNSNIPRKSSAAETAIENRIKKVEDDIVSVAGVLTNIMLVGKEKRKKCLFFDPSEGICKYWKLDIDIPTLYLVKGQDGYYVKIVQHPELCAVCTYWREGVYR